MKRRLLIIAIFLLLGAVVNVAVAWGCALWTIRVPGGAGRYGISEIWDMVHPTQADYHWLEESGWKPRPEDDDFVWKAASREISGFGLERKAFFHYPDLKPGRGRSFSDATFVIRDRSGWPLRALQAEKWLSEENVQYTRFESRFAIAIVPVTYSWKGRMIKDDRLLAYLPVWPNFAINTVFYAIVLWLLIPGPFALRRLIRRRRGLCPKCAYPMGESAVCTECGQTAPNRQWTAERSRTGLVA